jgi:hypothetical protein
LVPPRSGDGFVVVDYPTVASQSDFSSEI